jgi:hypothetical protein
VLKFPRTDTAAVNFGGCIQCTERIGTLVSVSREDPVATTRSRKAAYAAWASSRRWGEGWRSSAEGPDWPRQSGKTTSERITWGDWGEAAILEFRVERVRGNRVLARDAERNAAASGGPS